MKKLQYKTCCIQSNAEDIIDMVDHGRKITYQTFIKHVEYADTYNMFCRDFGWKTLKNDHCVRYYKSKFQGVPCYYLDHSAIEYIWT